VKKQEMLEEFIQGKKQAENSGTEKQSLTEMSQKTLSLIPL